MRSWRELKGRQWELFKKRKKNVSLPASIHMKGHVNPKRRARGLQIRRALPSPNQPVLAQEHEAPEVWKAVFCCLNYPAVHYSSPKWLNRSHSYNKCHDLLRPNRQSGAKGRAHYRKQVTGLSVRDSYQKERSWGALNKNELLRLMYLNACLSGSGTIWEELGGMVLLEELCH